MSNPIMTLKIASRWLHARKDKENLAPAQEIYKALEKQVSKGRGWMYYPRDGRAVLHAKKLPGIQSGPLTEKLWFEFSSEKGTYYNSSRQKIHIHTPLSLDDTILATLLPKVVKKRRAQIIHELIHHVDYHRMKGGWDEADKSYATPDQDPNAYYNHPLEMNAYFQMAAEPVQTEYQSILSQLEPRTGPNNPGSNDHQMAVWSLGDMANTSWNGFLKDWKRGTKDQGKWWDHLTPANRRRMQKRVYGLYANIVLDAQKRIRKLQRQGDPMAEML